MENFLIITIRIILILLVVGSIFMRIKTGKKIQKLPKTETKPISKINFILIFVSLAGLIIDLIFYFYYINIEIQFIHEVYEYIMLKIIVIFMITYSAFIYFLSKLPFFQIVQVKGIDDILGLHGVYAGYKNFNQTKLNKAIAKFIMLLLVLGIMIIPMIMGFSI